MMASVMMRLDLRSNSWTYNETSKSAWGKVGPDLRFARALIFLREANCELSIVVGEYLRYENSTSKVQLRSLE